MESCCTVQCDLPLDSSYWNAQWEQGAIGWDIGYASPPLVDMIHTIANKNSKILIPGCGSAYEAEYLVSQGFTDITLIDIAPEACELLRKKFQNQPSIHVLCEDFFQLRGSYDVILEQTFFCALPPYMRVHYAYQMYQLLADNGRLEGLLFDKEFDIQGPPFGGSMTEYQNLFSILFEIEYMERSSNSIAPRKDSELIFSLRKHPQYTVQLYTIQGVTCSGCKKEIEQKIMELSGVQKALMSSHFQELLIVSSETIPIETLRNTLSYEPKYQIGLIDTV